MGFLLRRTSSTSRRANPTATHSSHSNSSSNNSRSITAATTSSSSSSSSSSISTTSTTSTTSRRISKSSRKTRSRSSSPGSPRNNYYLDNPYQHHIRPRQPAVMMVPNSLLPVTAYFPRDYEFEFEDEGYDSSSSSDESSSYSAPALGWRPTQGTLEMEFMFGDMDDEFMQELTRESTPSSDADEMEVDTDSSSTASGYYNHYSSATAESAASGRTSGYRQEDRMGGRVVDEDYD